MNTQFLKRNTGHLARYIATPMLVGLALLGAVQADANEQKEKNGEKEKTVIVLHTVKSLSEIGEAVVASVPTEDALMEMGKAAQFEAAQQSNAVLASLHDILSMTSKNVRNTSDPMLNLDILEWATGFTMEYIDRIASNGPLLERMQGLETGQGEELSSRGSIEDPLGGLMQAASQHLPESKTKMNLGLDVDSQYQSEGRDGGVINVSFG